MRPYSKKLQALREAHFLKMQRSPLMQELLKNETDEPESTNSGLDSVANLLKCGSLGVPDKDQLKER